MNEDRLTIEELSRRTGVEVRTLRSWISEGLLAPPFRPGRGARYPSSNADRAAAVRALKKHRGLSLSEIGQLFIRATEEQIREWATGIGLTSAPPGSARDYLSRIRAGGTSTGSTRSATDSTRRESYGDVSEAPFSEQGLNRRSIKFRGTGRSESGGNELTSIEWLIFQLEKILGDSAPRHSRGEVWTRISVTSAFEISVRGELEPRERILFEQLADQFRAVLTGGGKND